MKIEEKSALSIRNSMCEDCRRKCAWLVRIVEEEQHSWHTEESMV